MKKEIHVKSYVRKDGTRVREHFRSIKDDVVMSMDDYSYDPVNETIVLHGNVKKMSIPDSTGAVSVQLWDKLY